MADRSLGGLCFWLDAEAPTDDEADGLGFADFTIVASYSTISPLG